MANLFVPENYSSPLSVRETERAIVLIKSYFQLALSTEMNLTRVTAPLFVASGTGINDDLNGVERPVRFAVKDMDDTQMEIVHSLAKWKRLQVTALGFAPGFGLYTDMNALRPDETLDNIHSIYVDQWDWEVRILESKRTLDFLKATVRRLYGVLKRTEFFVCDRYEQIKPILPDEITFYHSEDLLSMYPTLTPKERESKVCEQKGAVFVIGIGGRLADGTIHDGRAPDYDDWITPTGSGRRGLNGDLLVWNPVLGEAFELSSMGIRVSKESLLQQLEERGLSERRNLAFHKKLLAGELVQTMGGGIGQSRLCMYFLRKAHIGETQASVWPKEMIEQCHKSGIEIL